MKKKLCFILFLTFFILSELYSQTSQVKICSSLQGNNSLILDYYDTLTITYSELTANGHGVFMAEIDTYPGGRIVSLPSEMKVNDMDFYCENLMFGGCYGKCGPKQGLLGRLYVPNTLDWGQNMEYIILDWINDDISGLSILITNVIRVAEIREPQSCLTYFRFACVADCKVANQGDTTDLTALCDVKYNNGTWSVSVFVNADYNLVYSDVTVLDNYVVAVASNQSTCNIHLNLFNRNYPFMTNNAFPVSGIDVEDEQSGDKVLIESLTSDKFALANHYMSISESGHSVKVFNCCSGAPTLTSASHQVQSTIPMIDKTWELREMRFEPSTGLLYLLQQMDSPVSLTSESVVCEYDVYNFSSCSLLSSWVLNTKAYGIGLWASGGFQIIGTNGGVMTTYKKQGTLIPNMCADHKTTSYYLVSPKVKDVDDESTVLYSDYSSLYHNPTPGGVAINTECEE